MNREVRKKIFEKVISLEKYGINDLAWNKTDAQILINSIMQDDIGILGGSVFKIDSHDLMPLYDNWFCDRVENELKEEFNYRSKIKSLDYIKKYPVYENETILFSITFTENFDFISDEYDLQE